MLVSRWGNSLGVRLPRALVDNLGLKPGDTIALAHQIASGEFLHSDRFPGGPSPVVFSAAATSPLCSAIAAVACRTIATSHR